MAKQVKTNKRKKRPAEKVTEIDPDVPRKGHMNEYLKRHPPPAWFLERK